MGLAVKSLTVHGTEQIGPREPGQESRFHLRGGWATIFRFKKIGGFVARSTTNRTGHDMRSRRMFQGGSRKGNDEEMASAFHMKWERMFID